MFTPGPGSVRAGPYDRGVRILTWNLWWRFGPWEQRRKAILSVLRDARPDVIGLQEVWEAGGENLAEWLAGELDMHWAWGPAGLPPHWRPFVTELGESVGNAVLSRWPITEQEVRRLPSGDGPEEGRVALFALVETERVRVPFFTTHLHSAPFGSAVRCTQVAELARFVAERRAAGDFPPVITGDFNAEPDSDEMRLFAGAKTAPVVPGQTLIDVWRYADPQQPGATWDRANGYLTHPAAVSARIDYIHLGLPGLASRFGVRSVGRAGDGPVDGVWPSDHMAVVADLAVVPDA